MIVVNFLFFLSGFLFELRILENLFSERLISKHQLTKIGAVLLVIHCFFLVFVPKNIFFGSILLITNIIFIFFAEKWVRNMRMSGFQTQFIGFLTSVNLQMKSGKNFSQSFLLATEQLPTFYRERFVEIYNSLIFAENNGKPNTIPTYLNEVVNELLQIKNKPHNSLKCLQNLRKRLIKEEKYKLKGRLLRQQSQIQTIVLSVLYFLLLTYVLINHEFAKNLSLILLSLLLYLLGIALTLAIGRNHRWLV